ncbi:MAG TPA: protein kinase [Pseudomonadota bacterium]|nr:protein kinase [Pseudomonadota bacterium]
MLACLLLCACGSAGGEGRGHLAVSTYAEPFQYRFGESPRLGDGGWVFAGPAQSDEGWRPARPIGIQPGRNGAAVLWLRTRLSGPPMQRPTLSLRLAAHQVEVFLDGKSLPPGGAVPVAYEAATRMRGEYLLSLPADYAGKWLVLRLVSSAPPLGLESFPRIGEASAVTLDLVRRRADILACNVLLVLSALCSAALYWGHRTERLYLFYAGGCLSYAVSFVGFSTLGGLVFPWPLPSYPTQILFSLMAHAAMVSFVIEMIDAGPWRVLHAVRWLLLGFGAVFLAAVLFRPTMLPSLVSPYRGLGAILGLGLWSTAFSAWRHGNPDARILAWGMVATNLITIPEFLVLGGLVRMELGVLYAPTIMVFLGALAWLLVRRFLASQAAGMQLKLEHQHAEQRLHAQGALLQASARMAAGDLEQPIRADEGSPLRPLAQALDGMRADLRGKIQQLDSMQQTLRSQFEALQTRHREVDQLNVELRRQIEQRSRRLFDMLLSGAGQRQSSLELQPDDLLAEHYRVVRLLGQGGMGAVYEVIRLTDGTHLAAKVLRRGDFNKQAISRLAREAQIMARLHHPNLLAISDVDVTTGGVLFLVMELVQGRSLAQLRPRYGDVAWGRAILAQVADALATLHAHDIVHRDIKPENVLVSDGEGPLQAKLADLGIARLLRSAADRIKPAATPAETDGGAESMPREGPRLNLVVNKASADPREPTDEPGFPAAPTEAGTGEGPLDGLDHPPAIQADTQGGSASLTATGAIMGTPGYLAPELLHGAKQAQPAADVYSLGVMAIEVLTGSRPTGRRLLPVNEQDLAAGLYTLRGLPLPPALQALLERAISASPDERPAATELAAALRTT